MSGPSKAQAMLVNKTYTPKTTNSHHLVLSKDFSQHFAVFV